MSTDASCICRCRKANWLSAQMPTPMAPIAVVNTCGPFPRIGRTRDPIVEAYVGACAERRLGTVGEEALALPLPLASCVLTPTLFGFTSWWLDHPRAYTARQMASLCLRLMAGGLFKSPRAR
jgi:hypothetical protein